MHNKLNSVVAKFIVLGIATGLIILLGTFSFAAYHNRPFLVDGSFWFYQIIAHHNTFIDVSYVRFFNFCLQFPAVLFLGSIEGDGTAQAVRILNFSHSFFPFISLALSAIILSFRGRRDLILFPLLSFGLATMSTVAFSVGSVPNALSVFWPLYCLFLTRKINSTAHLLAILVMSAALAVTYEAVFLFFALFATVLLFQTDDFKKSKVNSTILTLTFIGITSYLLYRIFGPAAGSTQGFKASWSAPFSLFQKYSIVIMLSLCVSMWPLLQKTDRKWHKFFVFVMPLAALAISCLMVLRMLQDSTVATIWDSFNARVTAIPLAGGIAFLMFVFYYREKSGLKNLFCSQFLKGFGLAVVIVLFAVGFYDYQVTKQYVRGEQHLISILANHTGCYKMTRKEYVESLAPYGFADWSLPYASMLLAGKKNVDTVIFTEKEEGSFEKFNPCHVFANGVMKNDFDFEIPVGPDQRHFNYQKLLESLAPN